MMNFIISCSSKINFKRLKFLKNEGKKKDRKTHREERQQV